MAEEIKEILDDKLETLKDKSSWGGKRAKAGRGKGSQNKATIERKTAETALKQRILKSVDRLFNAQLALAEGQTYVMRIDETGEGKNKRREHNVVTSPEEIKAFLDEHEGGSGIVDDTYYYITTKAPDNRAIDSMMDRVFGKARQTIGLDGGEGQPISVEDKNLANAALASLFKSKHKQNGANTEHSERGNAKSS